MTLLGVEMEHESPYSLGVRFVALYGAPHPALLLQNFRVQGLGWFSD